MDKTSLFKLSYGLFLLTAKDGGKDNGCIINTVMQITSGDIPEAIISVNKSNLTHDMIMKTKEFNVSVLTTEAPFAVYKRFGLQLGRTVNKFDGVSAVSRSGSGILYLNKHTNAYFSFKVTGTMDFSTHTVFKGDIKRRKRYILILSEFCKTETSRCSKGGLSLYYLRIFP